MGNGVINSTSKDFKGASVPEVKKMFLGAFSMMKSNPTAGFRHWRFKLKSILLAEWPMIYSNNHHQSKCIACKNQ